MRDDEPRPVWTSLGTREEPGTLKQGVEMATLGSYVVRGF